MLERAWYSGAGWTIVLRPLAIIFGFLSRRRRRRLQARAVELACPVVIVGNIAVGGSGKTPLLLSLIELCREANLNVGVVSRGYGGQATQYPLEVTAVSDPRECGDEPALIAQRTEVPVVVDPDRVRAAQHLLAHYPVDLILSDDGLQHYRLARQFEIAVVDGARGLGNGALLPEGPLRERADRLAEVDLVVINGAGRFDYPDAVRYTLAPGRLRNLKTGELREATPEALGTAEVNALAGIGHPQRFFDTLADLGFDAAPTALADHAAIDVALLSRLSAKTLLMTEKDAVKCRATANENCWALRVDAQLDESAQQRIRASLTALVKNKIGKPTWQSGEINGS